MRTEPGYRNGPDPKACPIQRPGFRADAERREGGGIKAEKINAALTAVGYDTVV